MKKIALLLTFLGLFAALAPAAELTVPLKAEVPFEFMIGARQMPAGVYYFERHSSPHAIRIRPAASRDGVSVLVNPVYGSYAQPGQLLFNKYGGRVFLSQVWQPGRGAGNQLPKSRLERELATTRPIPVTVLAMVAR